MKIAIATDAWSPQVNGVVTSLQRTRDALLQLGHEVLMITPDERRTVPCPTYPEIRLSVLPGRSVARQITEFEPDCIHIATEATIGCAVRRYCIRHNLPFTTAYHTQLPEYVRARLPFPVRLTSALLRRFHSKSARVLAPTRSVRNQLLERGFERVVIWSRGVRTEEFTTDDPFEFDLPRPIWINVGRVAVEKNISAFLDLELPGSKVIVGDGPDRAALEKKYPECHFLGYKFGKELASLMAGADVFVFPSKTDTFGLVMLEAMACGLPVAAFPVSGPTDVVRHEVTGYLNSDLSVACAGALTVDRKNCRIYAESRSWSRSTRQFISHLEARCDEHAAPDDMPIPAEQAMIRIP